MKRQAELPSRNCPGFVESPRTYSLPKKGGEVGGFPENQLFPRCPGKLPGRGVVKCRPLDTWLSGTSDCKTPRCPTSGEAPKSIEVSGPPVAWVGIYDRAACPVAALPVIWPPGIAARGVLATFGHFLTLEPSSTHCTFFRCCCL